jgi:hypothetical protein
LTPQEKSRLEKLTQLFDYLKLSAFDPAVMPDEFMADFGDEIWILRDGKIEKFNILEDPLLSQKIPKIVEGLQRVSALRVREPGPLEQLAEELIKTANLASEQAKIIISQALNPETKPKPEEVIAALMILFKQGKIVDSLLSWEKELLNYLEANKETQGETYSQRVNILKDLKNGLRTSDALKLFLQILLIERLQIDSLEAAGIAARLVAKLPEEERPQYLGLAYYDLEKGAFVWQEMSQPENLKSS